jgi:hypothetical protein
VDRDRDSQGSVVHDGGTKEVVCLYENGRHIASNITFLLNTSRGTHRTLSNFGKCIPA